MNKILKYSIIVLMILSMVLNLFLLLMIGITDEEWEHSYYLNDVEWCENTNGWISYSNRLLQELQYYEPAYYNITSTDEVNCWSYEGYDEVIE